MNNLSYLIYLAGVINNIGNTVGGISTIATLAAIVSSIAYVLSVIFAGDRTADVATPLAAKTMKISIPLAVVVSFLFAIIPNRQTVMLIATSEVGDQLIANEKVNGVIDPSIELLKAWIAKTTQDFKQEAGK